ALSPRRSLHPARPPMAGTVKRLMAAGWPLTGAPDHGVSEAIYLDAPARNGVELYRDRPREEWPRTATGGLAMSTNRLDMAALLAEAGGGAATPPPGGPGGGGPRRFPPPPFPPPPTGGAPIAPTPEPRPLPPPPLL